VVGKKTGSNFGTSKKNQIEQLGMLRSYKKSEDIPSSVFKRTTSYRSLIPISSLIKSDQDSFFPNTKLYARPRLDGASPDPTQTTAIPAGGVQEEAEEYHGESGLEREGVAVLCDG
jgi:hypothetical protein